MYSTYILGVPGKFRGEELVTTLASYGIIPRIIWGPQVGVDNELIASKTNQAFANFSIKRNIKPQEVACCLGHSRMYEAFLSSSDEWGLFLEDDAIPIEDPNTLIRQLPKTQDSLHIFVHDGPGTNLPYKQENSLTRLGLIRLLDPPYGAYGYMLNRAAVKKILDSQIQTFINTPDWPYFWPKEMKFLVSKKVYFSHPQDLSMSIIGERINKEANLASQLPSVSRIIEGRRYTSNIRHIVYRELVQKCVRIYLQIRKKLR